MTTAIKQLKVVFAQTRFSLDGSDRSRLVEIAACGLGTRLEYIDNTGCLFLHLISPQLIVREGYYWSLWDWLNKHIMSPYNLSINPEQLDTLIVEVRND